MQKWNEEEESFVIKNKGHMSHIEMAQKIGKSVCSINRKVQRLNITKKQTGSRLSENGKRCSKCLVVKSAEEFANNITRVDGKESWCKDCRSFGCREKTYGITKEEFKMKEMAQDGRCAICNGKFEFMCVDHCHKTGKVRDLLCNLCNLMVGVSRESTEILGSAMEYLKKHKE